MVAKSWHETNSLAVSQARHFVCRYGVMHYGICVAVMWWGRGGKTAGEQLFFHNSHNLFHQIHIWQCFSFPFILSSSTQEKKGSLTEYQHIFISSPATDFLASHAVSFTGVVLSSSSWGGSGQYDPSKWLCGRPQTCEIYAEKSLHLPVSMAVHMLFSGDVCAFRLPFYDPQRNTF